MTSISSPRILLIALTLILVSLTGPAAAVDRQSDPDLLVGQTLLEEQRRIADQEAALKAELQKVEAGLDKLRNRSALYDGLLFKVLTAPIEWAKSLSLRIGPWMIVWVSLLLLFYSRIHRKDDWQRKKRRLKALYIAFLIVAILCLITAAASAQTTSPADRTLPDTLELINEQQSFEPWEAVLAALEDPICQGVEIPGEVQAWITERFPEAHLVSPVPDSGPQLLATIATIYIAAGNREKAFTTLEPLMDLRYNHRDTNAVHGFRTAIIIYTSAPDPVNAKGLARRVSRTYGPDALAWLAATIRSCCYDDALEYLETAKQRARSAVEVLAVASALIDFARGEDAYGYVQSKLRLTLDHEEMHLFLKFARETSQADLEQEILNYVIEKNDRTSRLVTLAVSLKDGGFEPPAKRALAKGLEKAEQMEELAAVSAPAFEWKLYDLLESTLVKMVDRHGPAAAGMTLPDPMILPVSKEKPLDERPSVAVMIGMLAEHRGDFETANLYYGDALNLELGSSINCQQFPERINMVNYFYPYRFLVERGRSGLLEEIEKVGRLIENYHLARLSEQRIEDLEAQLAAAGDAKWQLPIDLFFSKVRFALTILFLVYFVVFFAGLAWIFAYSQLVVVRRVKFHVSRLRHFRTLGGVLRFVEFEGFILLASVIFAPAALLMILAGQGGLALLYSELHQFRIASEFHDRAPGKWPINPMTYRQEEGRYPEPPESPPDGTTTVITNPDI